MMNGNMSMCKPEAASKTLLPEKRVKRQASGLEWGYNYKSATTQSNVDDYRKTEKADNVMNLICWGPTTS